jgi:surface antigen
MRRRVAALSVCLLAAASISACGDDEKQASKATQAAFELTGSGKNLTLSGPDTVEAGLVEIQFKNSAKGDHGLQLVRVDGDHTAADVQKAGDAWGDKGKPLPDWMHIEGGVFIGGSGAQTAVQSLEPGKHIAFDVDSDTGKEFEVTGEADGELPSTEGRIEALEYSFNTSGLKAGKNRVTFANTGRQPHLALIAQIKAGKTIADVREFAKTRKGEDPLVEKGAVSTGLLDGGRGQVIDLNLPKGNVALICFVSDREGGPPHVAKGMISAATVE